MGKLALRYKMKEREELVENTGMNSYNRYRLGQKYIPGTIDTIGEVRFESEKKILEAEVISEGKLINKKDIQFGLMQVYKNGDNVGRMPFEGSTPMVFLSMTAVDDTGKHRNSLKHLKKTTDIYTTEYQYDTVEEAVKSVDANMLHSAESVIVIDERDLVYGTVKDQIG